MTARLEGHGLVRIGLNATCFNDRPSGAKQRFQGIYGALVRDCPDIEFVVFEPSDCRVAKWFANAPNVSARQTPIPSSGRIGRAVQGVGYWHSALGRERLDIFESFHLPVVSTPNCRSLLTLHDLRPLRSGRLSVERLIYAKVLQRALADADRVISVSNTIRNEILAVDPSCHVTTVYNGIDVENFRNLECDLRSLQRKLGLNSPFILSVGHLEPRKNYETLIEAIGLLQAVRPVDLIIVGKDAGCKRGMERLIRKLGLVTRVQIFDDIVDVELQALYRLCEMMVFPSRYEGFGIPVLEAMAAFRATALSDIPVFREITENKGAYFPPSDADAIAATLAQILGSPAEQQRLTDYGAERVRAFDFTFLAAQVAGVYRSLLDQ